MIFKHFQQFQVCKTTENDLRNKISQRECLIFINVGVSIQPCHSTEAAFETVFKAGSN